MPKPGKTNVLYILCNGEPNEWAIRENVAVDSVENEVWVAKFTDVPDDVVADLKKGHEPSQIWERIEDLPSTILQ